MWKLIHETFEMIGRPIIPAKQLLDEIKDDECIWDLFKNGITCTLNQVDSDLATGYAKKYGIDSFEAGAFLAAAIRPAFDSWREQFLRREDYNTGSPQLNEVLKDSHGYILFQESLMRFFEWLGVTPAESIGLIKKISKKKIHPEDFANLEDRLRNNWIKQTGSVKGFDKTWELMQSTMSYGFASPHAAATSLDMCYGAWLKVHYPLEYYTVCFNNYMGDEVRTNKLKNELEYFDITLSDVKFRHSTGTYSCDKESGTIYKGVASIKHLNELAADELYELGKQPIDNFVDLLDKIKNETSVDSRQLDILIKIGFFDEFGDIGQLLDITEKFQNLAGKKIIKKDKIPDYGISEDLIKKYMSKETEKQYSFEPSAIMNMLAYYFKTAKIPKTPLTVRIKYQLEYLGYIDYRNDNLTPHHAIVTNVDTNYSPKVELYCLKNGKTCTVKVYKKKPRGRYDVRTLWYDKPLEIGDIIYMDKCKKEPAKTKNADGKWVNKPGEFNWWMIEYYRLEDIE